MKMAIASEADRDRAIRLFQLFETTVDRRWHSAPEIDGEEYDEFDSEYLEKFYNKCRELSPGLMRVVFGYLVLLDNCCDKSADHLTFRPDIARLIEAGERSIARMMSDLRDMNR